MPWRPLPRIAVAIATYPFAASSPADLPLEIGDDLYIIEQGGHDGSWYRGYLVAPPSLLAGLTSGKGQTLEARVFSGIFPKCCVEIREHLGENGANGRAQDQMTNGFTSDSDHASGSFPKRRSSFAYKKNLRRPESTDSFRRAGSRTNGHALKGEESASRSVRSPSQRRPDYSSGQSISRKLSHRSITSSQSRNSPVPDTPTIDMPRDPNLKRPQAPVPMLKIGDETPTSSSEPLVDEIASCLREWHSKHLHEMLLARRYSTLEQVSRLVSQLDLARRQLLHGVLTAQELSALREETVWNLVGGNKMLSNEVIVRDPKERGRLLTGDDSPVEMSKLQSVMSLLDRPPVFQHDAVNLYHLMVELKSFGANGLLSPTLAFQLCRRTYGEKLEVLSENFVVEIPPDEDFGKTAAAGKLRTLFTNLTSNDVGDSSTPGVELYLVVKLQVSQVVQASIMTTPRKPGNADENSQSGRPATGTPSGKGGRQSIMWAQKQFGSVRSRNQQPPRPNQTPSTSNSPLAKDDEIRPSTQDANRPGTQQGTQYVKKNIGVGVTRVKDIFDHTTAVEPHVAIWGPAPVLPHTQEPLDVNWNELIRGLIQSRNGAYGKVKGVEHMRLALQSFASQDANDLINKTPTLLQDIVATPKNDFPGAPTKPRSDIYITVSEVMLPSHALLSHPERGTVPMSQYLTLKNVQLTIEVRKKTGERIERCIMPDSNSPAQTAWRTCAAERGEPWNQTIKLVIPTEDVPNAHLIMSIADAPGFPFALCWMPLWIEDAFIKDGMHAPLLYLYDKVTSGSDQGRGAYLAYSWSSKGRHGDEKEEDLTGPVAKLKLETKLCSTMFSQDKILLGILNWRQQSGTQTLDLLRRFSFVPEIEIVKMVGKVLEALFGILINNSGEEDYEDAVFNALVTLLGIVHDRRFNLGPFVDIYAETKFDFPYATPCLIRSYARLLANTSDPTTSRHVRATFKVGRQVLKFILCAWEKQKLKEAGIGATTEPAIKRDIIALFTALERLVKDPSPASIGSQTIAVQQMPTWLPELKLSFSEEEVLKIVTRFLDACAEVQGKLILYKLVLVLQITITDLFSQSDMKHQIIGSTPRWINSYWGFRNDTTTQWREQVRLCCSIVSRQANAPDFNGANYLAKAVQSYSSLLTFDDVTKDSLSLLFPVTYPFPTKPLVKSATFDEALSELAAILAQLSGKPFDMPANVTAPHISNMISTTLEVVTSILAGVAFPKSWLSLYIYHHRYMLQILESLFTIMHANLVPPPDDADEFDTDIWNKFLTTLLILVRSDTLALETFPEQKRRAVWKIGGDIREQGAALLKRSWEALGWETSVSEQKRYGLQNLGGYQVQYVPGLVAPIVELCLSIHEGLRSTAVRILQAMIISEWTLNEELSVIQAEMIDCLDILFKDKNIGESMVQKMFVNELLDLFEPLSRMPLDPLWQAIRDMVATIDELLELLAAVHSPNMTESLRIMNTLQLMNFLKDMRKEDIFIRYVHQLADVQAKLGNKTEAGLAVKLHADQYTWEQTIAKPLSEPAFPEQTSFERKEQLCFEMVRYFEEGAAWDSALASYRELSNQYELAQYDFAKLARTQRSMATIYETIARGEWQAPRYFRVMYYGLGFPTSLRDRQFIFEGDSSERQSTFADRMRHLHPAAQIVSKGAADEMEGQYLQIAPVNVYRDLDHPIYQQAKVTQSTREYITATKACRFAITSKRYSPATGVQDQWIEKTVYSTSETFPTILRRSEIVAIDVVRLSPLQTAVERTTRKTAELAVFEKRVTGGDESGFSNLTEAIISSVDASSVSSVAQYRQLIPERPEQDGDDDSDEFTLSPVQNALQIALIDHVSTLKRCLSHYSSPTHLGTQTSLSDSLHATFAPEIARLAPVSSPEPSQFLSSPFLSSPAIPSISSPVLVNGNGTLTPEHNPDPRPSPRSRLSFNALKTSLQGKPNGSVSVHSDDGSSSGNVSQGVRSPHQGNASTHTPSSRTPSNLTPSNLTPSNLTPSKPKPNPFAATDDTASERPTTAHSGRSVKVKKRLSLLGLGRTSSSREKIRVEAMGGVTEE